MNPFVECFGADKGIKIYNEFQKIISNRVMPNISSDILKHLIKNEKENLRGVFL